MFRNSADILPIRHLKSAQNTKTRHIGHNYIGSQFFLKRLENTIKMKCDAFSDQSATDIAYKRRFLPDMYVRIWQYLPETDLDRGGNYKKFWLPRRRASELLIESARTDLAVSSAAGHCWNGSIIAVCGYKGGGDGKVLMYVSRTGDRCVFPDEENVGRNFTMPNDDEPGIEKKAINKHKKSTFSDVTLRNKEFLSSVKIH